MADSWVSPTQLLAILSQFSATPATDIDSKNILDIFVANSRAIVWIQAPLHGALSNLTAQLEQRCQTFPKTKRTDTISRILSGALAVVIDIFRHILGKVLPYIVAQFGPLHQLEYLSQLGLAPPPNGVISFPNAEYSKFRLAALESLIWIDRFTPPSRAWEYLYHSHSTTCRTASESPTTKAILLYCASGTIVNIAGDKTTFHILVMPNSHSSIRAS